MLMHSAICRVLSKVAAMLKLGLIYRAANRNIDRLKLRKLLSTYSYQYQVDHVIIYCQIIIDHQRIDLQKKGMKVYRSSVLHIC